jgi:hypothetical protein
MKRMLRTLIALLFGGIVFAALPAFAQVNLTGTSALTIQASPENPAPDSVLTLTAESPLLDLQDSDVEWSVNGNPAGSGQSIKITTGGLGQETDVSVSVSGASGTDSATLTIVPTSIDLLWEADSYVPPFYKGRAVPGSDSSIRVQAIPHFVNTDGSVVASSGINFTWKLNGALDEAQSGIGESSAVFPAAILYGSDLIEVDAQTEDGALSGEANITVRTQDPQLVLYEDNPLFGMMYHAAIPQSSVASESETSFAAVPYFANAVSANDSALTYSWTVNGSSVATDAQDPSEITIDAQSSNTANIALTLSNPYDAFFSASGAWQISFNATAAANGTNNVFESQ